MPENMIYVLWQSWLHYMHYYYNPKLDVKNKVESLPRNFNVSYLEKTSWKLDGLFHTFGWSTHWYLPHVVKKTERIQLW